MSKAKDKKKVEEGVCQEVDFLEQAQGDVKETQKKVNILPPKKEAEKNSAATLKREKAKKSKGRRAEYTVRECGLHAKKKFGVSSEVFFIATREAGKEDLDLITLKEGEQIVMDFMKREVK